MPDLTVTDTDPMAATTTPETGTEASADDRAGQATGEGQNAPFDPVEFLKGQGFDEATLKDAAAFKRKFDEGYVPKPEFTRKTQALAEERKAMEARNEAILEMARRVIAEKAAPQGPTPMELRKKELQELAQAGDSTAMQELLNIQVEERIRPMQEQVALRNAYENAVAAEPAVAQYWNEILPILEQNPALKRLAAVDNYAHADKVMIALGYEKKLQQLVPMLKTKDEEIASLKAKVAGYEKERAAGLPASTTRAGISKGVPGASGEPEDAIEAGRRAWVALGYRPEDYK